MAPRLIHLVRDSALYGLGSVSAKLLAIALLPVYVRYLSPADYGAVEAILTVDLLFTAVLRLGLQNALMRFYYDETDDGRGHVVVQTALWATMASATLGAIALVAVSGPLAAYLLGSSSRAELVWIGAFGIWSGTLYQLVMATFRLQQRARSFLQMAVCNVSLTAAVTLSLVVGFEAGAAGLLAGKFISQFVMSLVMAVRQRGLVAGVAVERSLLRQMLRFGLPTLPMGIANEGLRMVDRLFLTRMVGLTAVGLYGVGARMAQVVMLVVLALQLSWQPFAYSIKDDDEARLVYARVMTWFVASIGWLVVGTALLADPVVRLITIPSYFESARVVPLLALSAGIYGMYFIAGIGASRVKRTEYHFMVAASALGVSLVANTLLVPRYETIGAAIAALLANTTLSAVMFLRSQHVFHVPYDWRRMALAGVVVVVGVASAYALPVGEAWTLAPRVAGVLAYPAVIVALGCVPRKEVARALRRTRRRRGRPGDPVS